MKNNDSEDIKVIKYNQNNNNGEEQKNDMKDDMKTENQNDNNNITAKRRNSKLRSQRTKFPKGNVLNKTKEKKGGFSLFSCCLPSGKDDEGDE